LLGYSYLLQEKNTYTVVYIHYSLYVIEKRKIARLRLDLKSDTQDDILVFSDGSKREQKVHMQTTTQSSVEHVESPEADPKESVLQRLTKKSKQQQQKDISITALGRRKE
jgi:hypothetical protein